MLSTDMNSRRRSQPRLLRESPLTLALGGAAIVLLILNWSTPSQPTPWLFALGWAVMYATARFLSTSFLGGDFSFDHVLLSAAFLSLGLPVAVGIGVAGILLDQIGRLVVRAQFRLRPQSAKSIFGALGRALAQTGFCLGVGAWVFHLAGGEAPLTDAGILNLPALVALFLAYGLAAIFLRVLNAYTTEHPARTRWLEKILQGVVLDLVPLVLSPLLAVMYLRVSALLFAEMAAGMVFVMLLVRRVNVIETALQQRTRERASVSAIGQAIVSSLDLPELLEAIHQQIGPLMDARNFYVALYNEDYDELSFPLVYEDGQLVRYRSRSASNGLTEYVLRTRTPLFIPSDVAGTIRRLNLDPLPGRIARCWLGVPITIGDRALGVIAVQSHDQSGAYNTDDLELLSTIASQTAIAIENAQLYASTRRRAAELAILNSVSTAVGSLLNLDQVMEAIVSSVGPVIGCQKAAILLAQEGGRIFAPTASRGLSRDFLGQMSAMMRAARGETSASSIERQPLIVNDVRSDPRFENFHDPIETEDIRAFADMPLQARDHIIGTLAVFYTEAHRFTLAELDLLTTFANQAAVAVANASLFAQTDRALARRIEELAALEEIGRELTSTLDFNRVIERVLDAAIEFAGSSRGLVALYDSDRRRLRLTATRGHSPDVLGDGRAEQWLAGHAFIADAFRNGSTISIDDVLDDPNYQALDPSIRSLLIVPIRREGQSLGVIQLASDRRAAFSQDVASFVGQLATQAAIAIHNAQLYQQTQNRLREMSILFELSREVTSLLDLPELGRQLTTQLARALGTTHCTLELVRPNAGALEWIAQYTAPGSDPIHLPSAFGGDLRPLNADVLQHSRQPVIVDANTAVQVEFLRAQKLHALLGLPLIAGNQMIGRVIWMHSLPRAAFSADEIRFAQTLANQAGIALENARLFNERARRVNDLAQLYQASLALASSIEFDEALNRIAAIAREITGSDAVMVYLYDVRTDRIVEGQHVAGSERLFDVSTIRPQGMTRRVITTRQPAMVNDTLLDPDTNPRVLEAGIRSVIAMPILRKNEVLGVLYVNSRTPDHYTADSLQLIQLLANEAAVAIENTQLFSGISETRDRLAATLNSSRDGLLMFDVSGRVVVANPMLEQMWGIPRSALEGRRLSDLIDARDIDLSARLGYTPAALHALLQRVMRGESVEWARDIFTLPSPRERSIERTSMPVLDERGRRVGWMLVLRDVTEERELQAMREDLGNMIVHDLRSPLVAILDSYQLLLESMPPDMHIGMAGQALEVGQRSTRKLLDLVNSLLDISRFEHGQMPIDTQFAALRPLVNHAAEQLAPSLTDRDIQIENYTPDALPLVKVDEDQITRVLINLIDNAIKFSPTGGTVTISARVLENGAAGLSHAVVCSVRDEGPGIPAEHREHIFERFVRLSDRIERRRGTGLGLAFCKMAIEAHGGRIWVEDPPSGAGSQFSFTLPVAELVLTPM